VLYSGLQRLYVVCAVGEVFVALPVQYRVYQSSEQEGGETTTVPYQGVEMLQFMTAVMSFFMVMMNMLILMMRLVEESFSE